MSGQSRELERVERRLEQVEKLLMESMVDQQRMWFLLRRIEHLLETPKTYPRSTGGSITVK